MITQLIEQEERVKNTLEFLKKREDVCADMFKDMLLKKKICQKVPETKQKKKQEKKGAKGREEI